MRYFWRMKSESTKTITEWCVSCQNKSVCQKLAWSCKKLKSAQKLIYIIMPFLHEGLQLQRKPSGIHMVDLSALRSSRYLRVPQFKLYINVHLLPLLHCISCWRKTDVQYVIFILDSSSPDYHKSVCTQELTSLSSEMFHSKLWCVPILAIT